MERNIVDELKIWAYENLKIEKAVNGKRYRTLVNKVSSVYSEARRLICGMEVEFELLVFTMVENPTTKDFKWLRIEEGFCSKLGVCTYATPFIRGINVAELEQAKKWCSLNGYIATTVKYKVPLDKRV